MLTEERRRPDFSDYEKTVNRTLFKLRLDIKRLLSDQPSDRERKVMGGVKLPKIEVPTFDGNLINWATF